MKKVLIGLVILLVVVIIAIGCYYFFYYDMLPASLEENSLNIVNDIQNN